MKFLSENRNAQNLPAQTKSALESAQQERFEIVFANSGMFLKTVLDSLSIRLDIDPILYDRPAEFLGNMSYADLCAESRKYLANSQIPKSAHGNLATVISDNLQLTRAFADPQKAIDFIKSKIRKIADRFPRKASDIEVGRNRGDVIDPYIIAATQYLLFGGNFQSAIGAMVSHKALMMIEGLLGHLHEDVIGQMRGNVRAPEPRGKDQESFSYEVNPFPGTDVLQPPSYEGDVMKFHQIKSKTGSAKGGDGRRLGEQLKFTRDHYGGAIYYHALVGNTLVGHRSKRGVEKAAPNVIVLVGDASFRQLTHSDHGAELLLRTYQSAFVQISEETGYNIEDVKSTIAETFIHRANHAGDDFLNNLLNSVVSGDTNEQDSRLFNKR